MDDQNKLCELHRLDDSAVLSDVAQYLEARGIEADVWPEKASAPSPGPLARRA